jgi:hypothetical protein
MKNIFYTSLLSVCILCVQSSPLIAQPTDTSSSKDTKKEEIDKTVSSAVTLGVADGIIKVINNERRIKIRLGWNPLPTSQSLINQSISRDIDKVIKLTINSKEIENGSWIGRITNDDRQRLKEALGVISLEKFDQDKQKDQEIEGLLKNDILQVSEYIAMRREQKIVTSLLRSGGIQYSFGLKPSSDTILSPDFSDRNVTLNINIYPFKNGEKVYYYRFTASAAVEPFEMRVNKDDINVSDNKIFYDARFKLKKSKYLSSIVKYTYSIRSAIDVAPATVNTELASKSGDIQKSLTSLNGFLSIIGGSDQLGTVVQGLLGGTESASIVSGGLVGFKNGGVSPLIGVNQDVIKFSDDLTGGILFGIGLGEKTSLFVGPSIQHSIFTLSAGATIGTQANSEVNTAGMISVDLSRLTNSKQEPKPIQVSNSSTAVGFGEASEKIINQYTLVDYLSDRETVTLERICDENLKEITSPKSIINLSKTIKGIERIYIPRGVYEYIDKGKNKAYKSVTEDKLHNLDLNKSSDGQIEKPVCNAK